MTVRQISQPQFQHLQNQFSFQNFTQKLVLPASRAATELEHAALRTAKTFDYEGGGAYSAVLTSPRSVNEGGKIFAEWTAAREALNKIDNRLTSSMRGLHQTRGIDALKGVRNLVRDRVREMDAFQAGDIKRFPLGTNTERLSYLPYYQVAERIPAALEALRT